MNGTDPLAEELRKLREDRDAGSEFMGGLSDAIDKLDKLTSNNQAKLFGEVFSAKEIQKYNKELGNVQRNIRYMHREYRRVTQEINRMNDQMDDLQKKGQNIPGAMRSASVFMAQRQREMARAIAGGQEGLAQRQDYLRSQQGARARRERYKLAGAVALGGIKGYVLSRALQGLNIRIGQERAALEVEGGLGQRGLKSFGYRGIGLGMNPVDAMGALLQTGRAVGGVDKQAAYSNMLLAQGRNLSLGDLTGFQRAARFAGDRALGKVLNDTLVGAFKATKASPALLEEFLRGSTSVLQRMAGGSTQFTGREAAGLLSALSTRLGGVYQRSPERTAGLIGRLAAGMGPGGSEAMQAFKLRAMGFGSGRSYFQSIAEMERGATPENINRYLTQIDKEFGSMSLENKAGALYRLMGGNIKYHEALSLVQMGPGALTAGGPGVNRKQLLAQIRARTGDVRRKLAVDQEKARFAGSKAVQLALNKINRIERRFLQMLTAVSNFLASGKPKAKDIRRFYGSGVSAPGGGGKPASSYKVPKIVGRRRNKKGEIIIRDAQGNEFIVREEVDIPELNKGNK